MKKVFESFIIGGAVLLGALFAVACVAYIYFWFAGVAAGFDFLMGISAVPAIIISLLALLFLQGFAAIVLMVIGMIGLTKMLAWPLLGAIIFYLPTLGLWFAALFVMGISMFVLWLRTAISDIIRR